MDKVTKRGENALAWIAFIAVCMIGAAALIASGIRHRIGDDLAPTITSSPGALSQPSPAPAPIPKPGAAPTGAAFMQRA